MNNVLVVAVPQRALVLSGICLNVKYVFIWMSFPNKTQHKRNKLNVNQPRQRLEASGETEAFQLPLPN